MVCKKINQELHALAKVSKFTSKKKLIVIMKAFIMLRLSYCSLVWLFHRRTSNNKKKKKLDERALLMSIIIATFEELFNIDK